ncbi:autotransporter domain-containing protein [Pseudocitrobacter vendiensis]|uniref:Autotransporter protein or domain, integral membrane beta-barrel involved in protein secretion n=1 Tax=Pseudocitrobacter vendiensis TaxID=2488306 RepID=A0ABN8TAB4_9ENTR|nr:autotransporter domain-containing protein [Pseudocitrobacter vendiensis]CAH6636393.1 Autotransporter protein or domain, integral membrane beta-barrel involved in protein secretion [Pseudocitrobacter vendiensis]
MIDKKCTGFRPGVLTAPVFICLLFAASAHAWQQEYIVTDTESRTAERYTWDSDHQPRYDDILAERIKAASDGPGLAMTMPDETPLDATKSMSIGWNMPLTAGLTTGPVAAWRYDGSPASVFNDSGDNGSYTDPMWHASISTLGWRVDSRSWWGVHPWAQVSYNQQYGENQWKAQSGLNRMPGTNQEGNWVDVTLGADMFLNQHVAAYAALSQADNMTTGSNYLYTMGVSARF